MTKADPATQTVDVRRRNWLVGLAVLAVALVAILAFLLQGPQTKPENTTATPDAEQRAD